MKINKLASAISRGKWLIEPRTAMVERQRAIKFLNAEFEEGEQVEIDKPYAINAGSYFDITDENSDIFGIAEAGSVAIIPICGTIMKYDYCGSPGTDTLASWLKAAIASPQIDAIVLLVNSGGGSVEGTGEFADLIKQSSKTILAFCDGLMASAAYWIGCSASEIWASHETVEFGSIGTAVCFMDDSKAMEEMGYKDVYINADSSPDKNQDVIKAIAGDYSDIKNNIINPTNEIFMGAVKANRADKLVLTNIKIDGETYQEPLTGKVYLAKTAIENGLIDGISTLEQAIERSLEISKTDLNHDTKTTKMAVNEKQVKKSTSLLSRLTAFLSAETDDLETKADDDMEAKKADDDLDAKKTDDAPDAKAKKAEDGDPDDDDEDESDEDDIEVNGKTINLKNAEQVKAAFAEITAEANKQIADRDALLQEATSTIAENVEEMQKTETEIKKTIKSSFTLKGSSRANKSTASAEPVFEPESDVAKHAVKIALRNKGIK